MRQRVPVVGWKRGRRRSREVRSGARGDPVGRVKAEVKNQSGTASIFTRLWLLSEAGNLFWETLKKSSAVSDGYFLPILRFVRLEIHKVFLRLSNLDLTKNLSPATLYDCFRASP